jgi:hypothetical protein
MYSYVYYRLCTTIPHGFVHSHKDHIKSLGDDDKELRQFSTWDIHSLSKPPSRSKQV